MRETIKELAQLDGAFADAFIIMCQFFSLPCLLSRMPRRLTIVKSSKIARHNDRVCGCRDRTADMSAPTPVEIPTAATKT